MRQIFLLSLLAAPIACHSARPAGNAPVRESPGILQGRAWGTTWFLVIDDTTDRQRKAGETVKKRIAQFTQIFSTYETESEIQRLNRLPVGTETSVSKPMQDALLLSRELCEKSNGTFWPLLGELMIREGFEPDTLSPLQKPTGADRIDQSRPASSVHPARRDCKTIDIKGSTYRRRSTGRLNLNAVAEGLLLDAVHADLLSAGISHFLLEFGGEMIAAAGPLSRTTADQKWMAAIELLAGDKTNQTNEANSTECGSRGDLYVFYFEKSALSSSGTHRNRRNERSHLINRNNQGIPELRIASVLCSGERSGALADGLATTASLLTLAEARQTVGHYGQCALYYQAETRDGIIAYRSPTWPECH